MKKINRFLLMLFFLTCISSTTQEANTLVIWHVDTAIETPFRINCENFDLFFKEEIDSLATNDNRYILDFIKELNSLEEANLSKYSLPDTRIKVIIKYNGKIDYLCLDNFVLSKGDSVFVISESLKTLIDRLITTK